MNMLPLLWSGHRERASGRGRRIRRRRMSCRGVEAWRQGVRFAGLRRKNELDRLEVATVCDEYRTEHVMCLAVEQWET